MTSVRSILVAFAAGLAIPFCPNIAEACQPLSCWPGVLYPNGAVPANLPGLTWDPFGRLDAKAGFDASDITFRRLSDGADLDGGPTEGGADAGSAVSFSFTQLTAGGYLIRPDAALEPGGTYRVDATNFCWV